MSVMMARVGRFYAHVNRGERATLHGAGVETYAGYAEVGERVGDGLQVGSEAHQCRQHHVSCDPTHGLKVGDATHVRRSLMRIAIMAAPKPLSMFTTETPVAQLFSMPRSAARPLKLAPYPTDVGTATTGHETRPATTLARAPSMPAMTTIALADCSVSL